MSKNVGILTSISLINTAPGRFKVRNIFNIHYFTLMLHVITIPCSVELGMKKAL